MIWVVWIICLQNPYYYQLKKNLGQKTVNKIEGRLQKKYDLNLSNSMEQFHKIDAVLREFFGAGADGLEEKFLENICSMKTKNNNGNWIQIDDNTINTILLEAFADDDKKMILNSCLGKSQIIADVIIKNKIPQTSAYRKINSLVKNGLLVADGHYITSDGKQIIEYRSLIDNVNISIIKNKISVSVQINQDDFLKSSILQVIFG